jgi:hypothetical protein
MFVARSKSKGWIEHKQVGVLFSWRNPPKSQGKPASCGWRVPYVSVVIAWVPDGDDLRVNFRSEISARRASRLCYPGMARCSPLESC